jgi:hypothetical protein
MAAQRRRQRRGGKGEEQHTRVREAAAHGQRWWPHLVDDGGSLDNAAGRRIFFSHYAPCPSISALSDHLVMPHILSPFSSSPPTLTRKLQQPGKTERGVGAVGAGPPSGPADGLGMTMADSSSAAASAAAPIQADDVRAEETS